ncbi:MAG: hypothetical protein WA996_01985 [Candidatus Promineifilaceae bacterium]
MLPILISLTIVSVLSLIIGAAWLLLSGGQSDMRDDAEVGEEIAAELLQDDDDESIYQASAFKGQAKSVETGVSFSFREIKEEVWAGRWNTAAPLLMAVGGFLGLLVFGSLALLVALDDKLVGALIAGIAIFTVLRVIVGMVRA